MFAWLRPGDLIWTYWVNNYLQGQAPPPFDILYWNADTTRMPAALHRDFIELVLDRALATPGTATMLGSPVNLSRVDVDAYVIAGIADHLCPWQACYRTTQLLGGDVRFVLSSSGHIASMVNPPANPKARFQVSATNPPDPRDWLKSAATVPGAGGRTTRPGSRTEVVASRTGPAGWAAASTRRWSPHPACTSWTGSGPMPISFRGQAARSPRAAPSRRAASSGAGPPVMRSIVIDGQPLRVTVRPGTGAGVPLLLVNGIGASLELLQPFVDALDPAIDVIRFDVPGVGGSPLPARPYRFTGLCRMMARLLSALGYAQADVLGISWGGGGGPALRCLAARTLPPPGAGQYGYRLADGAGQAGCAGAMVTPRRYLDRGYLRTWPPTSTAARRAPTRTGSAR